MGTNRVVNLFLTREKEEIVVLKGIIYRYWDSAIRKIVSPLLIDSEAKFNDVLNSDFNQIAGNYMDFIPQTFDEYKELINKKLQIERRLRKNDVLELSDLKIVLRHQLQPHEAESYYEASMTLVINGNEVDKYFDGMDRIPPLPFEVPGYIHFEGNYGKILDIVSEQDRIDFPLLQDENTKRSRTYISKKCIDKALLYKLYKDPATIGTPKSSRAYTGKVEVVELDMHHIDEQVLEVFIQHGVIRMQEPVGETEKEQMIAHAKSEAEKSAQRYKEWLLQQQNK
jgi:hypothetical protein